MLMSAVIDEWAVLNPHIDRWRLGHIKGYFGTRDASEVTLDDLVKMRGVLHLGTSYMRDVVQVARRICVWAHEHGWLPVVPTMPRLPRRVKRPRDVDPKQVAAALARLRGPANRILSFIAATGCRPSEATTLTWSMVDLGRAQAVLPLHKTAGRTGLPRILYLSGAALDILKQAAAVDGDRGPVFRNRVGVPYTPAGLRAILKRHGITPYQLRHTYAQLASEQVPVDVLARLMGHRSIQMTQWYYEVRDSRAGSWANQVRLPWASGTPGTPTPTTAAS